MHQHLLYVLAQAADQGGSDTGTIITGLAAFVAAIAGLVTATGWKVRRNSKPPPDATATVDKPADAVEPAADAAVQALRDTIAAQEALAEVREQTIGDLRAHVADIRRQLDDVRADNARLTAEIDKFEQEMRVAALEHGELLALKHEVLDLRRRVDERR